jgi:methylated-DNA-[protein]-cysteine S-methyltransferase
MNLKGTKFQLKVWNYLRKIPKGKVKTYLEVAKAIGKPKAFRAVANAVGKNPYPPKIPCHRVIRSDGSPWWLLRKRWYSAKKAIIEIREGLNKIAFFICQILKLTAKINTYKLF